MVDHIIKEYSKVAQNDYKTRNDWVGKETHEELCKKLKFDYTTKWYEHTVKSVLGNETNEIN